MSQSHMRAELSHGMNDISPISPSSNAAILAFQSAGRKRTINKSTDNSDYDAQRVKEREEEERNQQRIRNKAPGKRQNGLPRTGNIDGMRD